eukprot:1608978-Amphidinium_carterae.1
MDAAVCHFAGGVLTASRGLHSLGTDLNHFGWTSSILSLRVCRRNMTDTWEAFSEILPDKLRKHATQTSPALWLQLQLLAKKLVNVRWVIG